MSDFVKDTNVPTNDLIYRQAAIDALKEKVFHNLTDEFYAAMQVMDELPSAQPMQWIPCSERLPDGRLNKSYLVQDKDGRRAVGTYTNWGWMFAHYMNDPVAWMPLPEPYKGGDEE